jgi:hypothetical protein
MQEPVGPGTDDVDYRFEYPPHRCTTGSFWMDLFHNIFNGGVHREDCIETKRVDREIAEREAARQKK